MTDLKAVAREMYDDVGAGSDIDAAIERIKPLTKPHRTGTAISLQSSC